MVRLDDGTRARVVEGYHDARAVLRASERFSRSRTTDVGGSCLSDRLLSVEQLDPPRHTQIRALLGESLTARSVGRMLGTVDRIADGLVGDLRDGGSPADLVGRFCLPLAFTIQFEVLGVPQPARQKLYALSARRSSHRPAPLSPAERAQAELDFNRALQQVLARCRRRPGTGLFDRLIAECTGDGVIDDGELLLHADSMLRDGPFLAAMQLANSVAYLLDHPQLLARLRERRELVPAAVEELLRLCPAINHSLPRVAVVDTELSAGTVPAGGNVTACIPAVNLDPRAFSAAAEFDLDRGRRHLSFGHGIHYCLGAHLARLEIQTGLQVLLERLPGLRLATPRSALRRFVTFGAVGVSQLPVAW